MENTHFLPPHYRPKLDLYHTQLAIKQAKDDFEDELAALLHLSRVSAPLFVDKATGLNDDLNGVERPVEFDIKEQPGIAVQVEALRAGPLWIPRGPGPLHGHERHPPGRDHR